MTEEDSQPSLIHLLKKKKEVQEMEKMLAGKDKVRKMGGCWAGLWFFGGRWQILGAGSHATLTLGLPGPQGEDESHC